MTSSPNATCGFGGVGSVQCDQGSILPHRGDEVPAGVLPHAPEVLQDMQVHGEGRQSMLLLKGADEVIRETRGIFERGR